MVLIDTSAWIEFLRDTGSFTCQTVDTLLGDQLASTDPVVMEVLAGARDESQLGDLRALLNRTQVIRCGADDYLAAAALYRQCRQRGVTIRRLIDCLIAAVAIRAHIPLLQADRDFELIAEHSSLKLHA